MIGGEAYGGYVRERVSHIKRQRGVLQRTYRQGAAFLKCFRQQMTAEQIRIAEQFAGIERQGWFGRRIRLIANGFYKSGFVRNVGLLLMM